MQHSFSDVTPFMQFQAAIQRNICHGRALHCSSEPFQFLVDSAWRSLGSLISNDCEEMCKEPLFETASHISDACNLQADQHVSSLDQHTTGREMRRLDQKNKTPLLLFLYSFWQKMSQDKQIKQLLTEVAGRV